MSTDRPLSDLGEGMVDARGTLLVLEEAHRQRRRAEAVILFAATTWADQHGDDGRTHDRDGYANRLVQVGGVGTPTVKEFCFEDFAVVLEKHPLAARALVADALDLRHRLPKLWALVLDGRTECWVARKIAWHTRRLSLLAVARIDDRIAGYTDDAATLPPARLKELVEALVADADASDADAEREAARRTRFVSISEHEKAPGIAGVYGRVDSLGGRQLDDTISRIAQALADAGDEDPVDVRRSKALAILATPALALRIMLTGAVPGARPATADETSTERPDDESDEAALARLLRDLPVEKLVPTLVLYLHLTDATLFGADPASDGVARWEGVGPITQAHLLDLLGHTRVDVRPVFLPTEVRPSDAYEYAGRLREGIRLLIPADSYPYAVSTSRSHDVDHTVPYDADGPPGQTRYGNAGPMTRHHHRIKTSGRMRVRQPRPGVFVWRTPHGRYRMTSPSGTHDIDPALGEAVHGDSPVQAELATCLLLHAARRR